MSDSTPIPAEQRPMTGPNVPLLTATMQHIETHPEEWNQHRWRCGTAACYAGRAVLLDGGTWDTDADSADPYLVARDTDPVVETWPSLNGSGHRVIHVNDRARHILGLTNEQANNLFYSANTLDDLRAQVAAIIGLDGAR